LASGLKRMLATPPQPKRAKDICGFFPPEDRKDRCESWCAEANTSACEQVSKPFLAALLAVVLPATEGGGCAERIRTYEAGDASAQEV
jgi:hypothetical protein